MRPMREIRPTIATPAPMPAFAPEESLEEDVAVEDGVLGEDVAVTRTTEVETGIDVLGLELEIDIELELELELELDEEVVETKSEAWYRIETP
jgi:hypothetical protein